VNEFHITKAESPDSPSGSAYQVKSLLDRIAVLEGENADQQATYKDELAAMSSRLERAERKASKFKRNATEADDESGGLRDRLSEAEQSMQSLRAEVINNKALAEGFEQQIRVSISVAGTTASAASQISRAVSTEPSPPSASSQ